MKPLLLPMVLCGLLCACAHMEAGGSPDDRSGRHVDPRDGHVYRTIEMGGLIWFAENLAYMPGVGPGAEPGGIWVFGYEGREPAEARKASQYRAYGNLYDWNTALAACPEGWHLPSDEEWAALEIALGMTQAEAAGLAWRGSDQGARLKQGGDSGFDVVLAGWRSSGGTFGFVGQHANFWTATSVGEQAYERLFNIKRPTVGRDLGDKTAGFSVRCVRPATGETAQRTLSGEA
ncbi:MAG TPA: FISUMP domain-containing protein [Xanthomonadaceae bacterium]|nr:FISUMP domain-containing protein [Xanthomonadaceae bacterium]